MAIEWIVAFAIGGVTWTFVEYAIHGLMSHRFETFVSPLHGVHHHSPRNVFTSPLAVAPPVGLLFAIIAAIAGSATAFAFSAGLLAGFIRYERIHWRIHFREPRNDRERRLRSHHLVHHFRNPRAYHGVTTRFWDRVFGTLPDTWPADYAHYAHTVPIAGRSNLRDVWNPRRVIESVREARRTSGNGD